MIMVRVPCDANLAGGHGGLTLPVASKRPAVWRPAVVKEGALFSLVLFALAVVPTGCGGATPGAWGPAPSRFDGMSANGLTAPDFALRDQHGQMIRLSAERGRFVVLTFLYVDCRDVCPVIAGQLNQALRELGPARNDVRVLAVSVDPKGDTPAAVRHFIAVHRLLPQFLYLTGTTRTLEPI